ncbi:hypothetical protein ACH5RR_019563 [Cinchona calisaya]|uniref:Uncharacterized protein n=1 Tax=Cinchona calisaya TaxID=153742 RepID=A0ABD2ZPR2_9GENT
MVFLAVANESGMVRTYDLDTGTRAEIGIGHEVLKMAFSMDGYLFVSTAVRVRQYSVNLGPDDNIQYGFVREFGAGEDGDSFIEDFCFASHQQRRDLIICSDRCVSICDLSTGQLRGRIAANEPRVVHYLKERDWGVYVDVYGRMTGWSLESMELKFNELLRDDAEILTVASARHQEDPPSESIFVGIGFVALYIPGYFPDLVEHHAPGYEFPDLSDHHDFIPNAIYPGYAITFSNPDAGSILDQIHPGDVIQTVVANADGTKVYVGTQGGDVFECQAREINNRVEFSSRLMLNYGGEVITSLAFT